MRTFPFSRTVAAAAAGLALSGFTLANLAIAAPPIETERPGRYNMQPVEGGILRLDTETGAMSMCAKRGAAFNCDPVQDDRSGQKELERLTAENRDLRSEIKRMEEIMGLGGTPGGGQPAPQTGPRTGQAEQPSEDRPISRSPKFELPSEEDVDKALTYVERMLKKFRDKLKDFESDSRPGGRGTPL